MICCAALVECIEGCFLVPEGFRDGRYAVRILLHDSSGARISETKHFILTARLSPARTARIRLPRRPGPDQGPHR